MPFNPDEYLAEKAASGGFDPDAYLSARAAAPSPLEGDVGAGEAALQGATQGLTLGFADELGGGLQAAAQKLQGSETPLLDLYVQHRDKLRQDLERARKAHPYITGGAQFLGSIPTVLATGGAGLGSAALAGGAMAAGESNADLTKGEVMPLVKDTATGAVIGAGTAGLAEAASPYVQKAANYLGVKSLGPRMKDLRNVVGTDKIDEMGQALHDSGIIKPLQSAEGAFGALSDKTDELGNAIEQGFANAPTNPVIDAAEIANSVKKGAAENLKYIPEGGKTLDRLSGYLDNELSPMGGLPVEDAWKVRKGIDQAVDFQKQVPDMPGFMQGLVSTRNALQDAIKENAPAGMAGDMRQYHLMKSAEDIAKNTAARNMANRSVSPSDYIAGLAGLVKGHGDPVTGVVMGGLNHLARTRGNSTAAWTLNKLAGALQKNPNLFGTYAAPLMNAAKRGENSLAAAHFLMSQQDPGYRETLNQIDGE